jgi:hypothetical protein
MATAKLIVFCTPEELGQWLEEMKETRDAAVLWFVKSRDLGEVVKPRESLPPLHDAWRIFLLPASAAPDGGVELEDVRARERGWVDVKPPVRARADGRSLLLMASIQGDDASSGTSFASKQVRWLKRHLKASLRGPVEAVDVVTDAAEIYKDIYFTDAAADEHREGAEWRQFPKGNVVFRPASGPA